jgi:hypothetical protein
MENSKKITQKIKIKIIYHPVIPLLGIYQKEIRLLKKYKFPCSLQHYSGKTSYKNKLRVHQQMNKDTNTHTDTQMNEKMWDTHTHMHTHID